MMLNEHALREEARHLGKTLVVIRKSQRNASRNTLLRSQIVDKGTC
jgi:hypothetical protein